MVNRERLLLISNVVRTMCHIMIFIFVCKYIAVYRVKKSRVKQRVKLGILAVSLVTIYKLFNLNFLISFGFGSDVKKFGLSAFSSNDQYL